jgi:hypothetical protein
VPTPHQRDAISQFVFAEPLACSPQRRLLHVKPHDAPVAPHGSGERYRVAPVPDRRIDGHITVPKNTFHDSVRFLQDGRQSGTTFFHAHSVCWCRLRARVFMLNNPGGLLAQSAFICVRFSVVLT